MKCPNCGEVNHDEDAIFCASCGAKMINKNNDVKLDKIDAAVLNIIRVGSNKENVLASYIARKKCYEICKEETKRSDYKEYVETLQLDYFPNEFKKAELGKSYAKSLLGVIITIVLGVFLCMACFPWFLYFLEDGEFFGVWGGVAIVAIMVVMSFVLKTMIKKMNVISKSVKEIK